MATENKSSQSPDQMERLFTQLSEDNRYKFIVEYDDTGHSKISREIPSRKTWWDWLNLLGVLAVPLVVAGATLLLSIQQANLAQQQHDNDQKIAQQQYQANLQNSLDQQHTTILQTYLTNLQDLLLNHNLLKSKPNDDVREIARTQTLTALQRLGNDIDSKKSLVLFLYQAGLINAWDSKGNIPSTIIDLHFVVGIQPPHMEHNPYFANLALYADLSGAELQDLPIVGIDLSGVELSNAHFDDAYLIHANLSDAILEGADLAGADLVGADLYDANLTGANLAGAYLGASLSGDPRSHGIRYLPNASITQQQLDEVSTCQGATLPPGLTCHK